MSQSSLLFASHPDLQRMGRMNVSNSSPPMAYDYHPTLSSGAGWSQQIFSCGPQRTQQEQNRATLIYSETPMQSPWVQLPPTGPYSLPLVQWQAEFAFSLQNIMSPSESKDWRRHIEPQSYHHTPSVSPSPGWPLRSIEPLDSNCWSEMILSGLAVPSPSAVQYTTQSPPPLRYLLPTPSPSPSVSSSGRLSPISCTGSGAPVRRMTVDTDTHIKMCSHCSATSTPLWRRDPATHRPLCNACGLYLQQRNKMRPAALIAADQRDDDDDSDAGLAPGAPECSHCHTHRTSVWRRSKTGAKLCNACGVYARLRGRDRPLSLRRNRIRPRYKHPKET
ncbi:hypothetical protein B0H17DRAFT_1220402 [Mycena rosella]|uniref:GATA-type domain-containing protein n=1 Tax=Mycena rosella TaxID=1033263 RepID=A0AAD7BAL3_MYCRO|nr:hypothetical protein B0H17DRAFT_1220402 [Mycena rosella]